MAPERSDPLKASPSSYYYADGKRIPLELDPERAAIDRSAEPGGLSVQQRSLVDQATRPLPGRLGLLSVGRVPPHVLESLESAGALHPVYRHDDTSIVVLPEVRMEIDPGRETAALETIEQGPVPARVVRQEDGQIVLAPRTGRGADALRLANFVQESVAPAMVQARFIRIVPSPGVVRSPGAKRPR